MKSNKLKDDPYAERKMNAKNGSIDVNTLRRSEHALMGIYYKGKQMDKQKENMQQEVQR